MLLTRSLPKIDQYDAEVRYSLQYSNAINNWSSMLSLPGRPVLSFVFECARTTFVIWLKVPGCTPHKRLNSSGLRFFTFS